MNARLEKRNDKKTYDHLLAVVSSKRFLEKKGLGNEVPFFICDYPPEQAINMEKLKNQLRNKLEEKGVAILEVNLYDLAVELLQRRGLWDQILAKEPTLQKDELKELLQALLDSEKHLVPAIADKMARNDFQVMFITGVGEVFPYIRSHNVLNNLQSTAKEKPTLMFFPGSYTQSREYGASLDLFGRLHDDKYYRAFNIFHCEA